MSITPQPRATQTPVAEGYWNRRYPASSIRIRTQSSLRNVHERQSTTCHRLYSFRKTSFQHESAVTARRRPQFCTLQPRSILLLPAPIHPWQNNLSYFTVLAPNLLPSFLSVRLNSSGVDTLVWTSRLCSHQRKNYILYPPIHRWDSLPKSARNRLNIFMKNSQSSCPTIT